VQTKNAERFLQSFATAPGAAAALLSSRNINGLTLLGLAAACRNSAFEAVLRAHGALL